MKILFVNQHMKMGGIAGSLYNALHLLKKETDWQVDWVVFDPYFDEKFKNLEHIKFYVPFWLKFLYIRKKEALKKLPWFQIPIFLSVKLLAKIIGINRSRLFLIKRLRLPEHYDIAVSYSNDIPVHDVLTGTNDFVLHAVSASQKIAWIHNDLDKLGFDRSYVLRRYADFDKIVNVSEGCKQQLDEMAPEFKSKSYYVHNYIDAQTINRKADAFNPYQNKNTPVLVTVARIDNQQKRIDRILQAAQKLQENKVAFKWYVVGDGKDLSSLKKQAEEAGLTGVLIFTGFQPNPYPYVKHADLFVLTSDYEAQPLALTESFIIGTPVVTTDFPAAWEFVRTGQNGYVVDKDANSIYQILSDLLQNPEHLQNLKKNARHNKLDIKSLYLSELNHLFNDRPE